MLLLTDSSTKIIFLSNEWQIYDIHFTTRNIDTSINISLWKNDCEIPAEWLCNSIQLEKGHNYSLDSKDIKYLFEFNSTGPLGKQSFKSLFNVQLLDFYRQISNNSLGKVIPEDIINSISYIEECYKNTNQI